MRSGLRKVRLTWGFLLVAQVCLAGGSFSKPPSKSNSTREPFESELKQFKNKIRKIHKEIENPSLSQICLSFSTAFNQDRDLRNAFSRAEVVHLAYQEFLSLRLYTVVQACRCINKILGLGTPHDQEALQPLLIQMDSALQKLPDYHGTVIRAKDLPLEAIQGEYVKGYEVGKVIHNANYTSSTRADEPPYTFKSKNTYFKINSKHGKDISGISLVPEESEVLFPRGTRFKVLRSLTRDHSPDGHAWVEMDEVEADGKAPLSNPDSHDGSF